MVINGRSLLISNPIVNMIGEKRTEHGVSYGLAEVGYDIRLKQGITFHVRSHNPYVRIENGQNTDFENGRFIIASAMEEFQMPTNLMGIVHDKSTWARKGLSVFNTVIEPGWRGFLTLELVYHGSEDLYLAPGSGIAQVVFHRISEPAVYEGKYQDQANQPVPAILEYQV